MSGLRKIRVIDTETTGLPEAGPVDLVEIGYTDMIEDMGGRLIVSGVPVSALVRPTVPISFGAMAAHHITEAEAANGISQADARAFIAGADVYAAHNAAFDSAILAMDGRLPWICTFKCAKTAWPDLESHSNGAIRYARGLCLDTESAAMAQPSHRAGPDTWVTAAILADLSAIFTVDQMIEISANPVRLLRIGFGKHRGARFSELPTDYLDWLVNKSDMKNDPKNEDAVHSARLELRDRFGGRP